MDFAAPPLLGYAGGAGLLEYTGAGAEAGAGTADDPVVWSSSDEDDAESQGDTGSREIQSHPANSLPQCP